MQMTTTRYVNDENYSMIPRECTYDQSGSVWVSERDYEELEAQVKQLAAELSAVDEIHNEAVFITDDDYDKCPKRVQDIIRHLAVMQIPAYQSFVDSLRAEGLEMLAKQCEGYATNHVYSFTREHALDFAAQLRSQSEQVKGVQS